MTIAVEVALIFRSKYFNEAYPASKTNGWQSVLMTVTADLRVGSGNVFFLA
jgi:hypothetical protein